jgi:hypothetical protein
LWTFSGFFEFVMKQRFFLDKKESGPPSLLAWGPASPVRQVSEREPQSNRSLCGWQLGSRGSGLAARMARGRWPDAGKARPKLAREV